MPSILSLPVELVSHVIDDLDVHDISAFSRSCRALHYITTPLLYDVAKNVAWVMCWAVDQGRQKTLEHLLAAGANPNIAWAQPCTRSETLRFICGDNPPTPTLETSFLYGAELSNFGALPPDFPPYHEGEFEPDNSDYEEEGMVFGFGMSGLDYSDDLDSQYYWTPLHIAARWGNNEMIDLLLKYGADIHSLSRGFCDCILPQKDSHVSLNTDTSTGVNPIWMPLHTAICHGHESTVRLLISRGASVNISPRLLGSDSRHVTALHSACYSDMSSISSFLINKGYQTDVDIEDHAGASPISYAYFTGSWASIDFLVESGASLNARLGNMTLLKHACYGGRFAEALRFIELGADVASSLEPSDDTDPILHCCCTPQVRTLKRESDQEHFRGEIFRTLVKHGANLEERDSNAMTPLMKAALFNDDEAVEALLAEGADINAEDDSGKNALLKACRPIGLTSPKGAMLRTVRALLSHMPPNIDTFDALAALCESRRHSKDKVDVVRRLIWHGGPPSLDSIGGQGQLLLTKGMRSANFDLCDVLFETGLRTPNSLELDIMVKWLMEIDNARALEYITKFQDTSKVLKGARIVFDAIQAGASSCAIFLIGAGAPTDYHTDDGESCLIEACKLRDTAVAELLLEWNGVSPNECFGGSLPLTHPVLNENIPMIKTLLEYGAVMHRHPNGTRINGRVFGPLDLAIFCGLEEAVEAFVNHESFFDSTEEERNAHLQTACCVDGAAFVEGNILDILLTTGNLNPDTIFPGVNATPLHLSLERENLEAVICLVSAGANIHQYIPPASSSLVATAPNPFEGSTPLQWAIENASNFSFIEELLVDPIDAGYPEAPLLSYVRAACRRHNPEMMKLLLDAGLDPNTSDEANNSFLSIFCQAIDTILSSEDPGWSASEIAAMSAKCVVTLLDHGADPHRRNAEGISALDRVRQIIAYDGSSEFHQVLAKSWNEALILDEVGIRER
ncbi:ankyrin [Hypoxylon fragiforme]|uniref:ankyrin n=1 Tax=Hypoxylon fragiforme TaxID=63214 RepID=UPI0020C5D134|nr:ankyrin [Hypoxylon fragiforme]KAI2608053.1 ankyrin [Hypoxylon fragiforme]